MTYIDAPYVRSGDELAIAYANTSERATNLSEMSLMELLEGLVHACDKEIASKDATENL
jgi:hypothetical protein